MLGCTLTAGAAFWYTEPKVVLLRRGEAWLAGCTKERGHRTAGACEVEITVAGAARGCNCCSTRPTPIR